MTANHHEHVQDPRTRAVCRALEGLADDWRQAVRWIETTMQTIAQLEHVERLNTKYPLASADFRRRLSMTIDSFRLLKHESDQMRDVDKEMRAMGFDARRCGTKLTENPFIIVTANPDTKPEPYDIEVKERAAIPWYIGWKQGARAGEQYITE